MVDDNSPDGTSNIVKGLQEPSFLHGFKGKVRYGSAIEKFSFALQRDLIQLFKWTQIFRIP